MRQFYETYHAEEKVAPLVRQLSWSHNVIIFSQSKRPQEREFYVRMAVQEKWSKRELERQFKEYQVQLPDKQLLQAKLHEFYALNIAQGEGTE